MPREVSAEEEPDNQAQPLGLGPIPAPDAPRGLIQSISSSIASNTLSLQEHRGAMTTSTGPSRTRRHTWWRSELTARVTLAGAFVAILLGVVYATGDWARIVASLAGFATAITLIAAGVIGWEHVVGDARSAGLVEPPHSTPPS
jgi:hypothetical protein